MTPRQLRSATRFSAYCRRLAAVHEAGHAVVARQLGVVVERSWIWPAPAGNPWRGRTNHEPTSLECRRAIAIAGAVAETCWRDHDGAVWRDAMSSSDWRSAGCEPDEPDAASLEASERVR